MLDAGTSLAGPGRQIFDRSSSRKFTEILGYSIPRTGVPLPPTWNASREGPPVWRSNVPRRFVVSVIPERYERRRQGKRSATDAHTAFHRRTAGVSRRNGIRDATDRVAAPGGSGSGTAPERAGGRTGRRCDRLGPPHLPGVGEHHHGAPGAVRPRGLAAEAGGPPRLLPHPPREPLGDDPRAHRRHRTPAQRSSTPRSWLALCAGSGRRAPISPGISSPPACVGRWSCRGAATRRPPSD